MTSALTKKELRRNPLAEWIGKGVVVLRAHRMVVIAVLVIIGLGSAGWAARWWYEKQRGDKASRALVEARALLQGDKPGTPGKPEEAMRRLQSVAQEYRGTPSGEEALVRLGDLHYDNGKIDEAKAAYDEYLKIYPHGRFLMLAGLGKAYAQEAKGDFQGAAQTLNDALNTAKENPLAGEAYSSLARVYEELKKPEDALRVYGQIVEKYSQTQWAQHALQRMSALKSK